MEANTDKKLKIYRASAGSGKTWRLTVEFLRLIITDPMNYRHILAVTFTNKAAGEMRERAVNELYKISRGKGDPAILAEISNNIDFGKITPQKVLKEVCKRAKIAIILILHDYSRFRFQTIDTFFQSVLRNLARELGLGSHFNIDLDSEAAVDKAVDLMFDKASEHPDLFKWIESYTFEVLEDKGKRDVRNGLKKFGNNIFNESFQEKESELRVLLKDKDFLTDYRRQLDGILQQGFGELREPVDTFFLLMKENGLSVEDFFYKQKGAAGYFAKIRKACDDQDSTPLENEPGSYVDNALTDENKWVTKSSIHGALIRRLARERLIPLLTRLLEKRAEVLPRIITAQLIRENLYKAGLLCDIADEIDSNSRDNGRFLLGHTAPLLKAMIGENDAPFVFEKTGVELHHMMIDEFQDTSLMQWSNFKPMLREGLANGHDSLIVGDTKQSIYRFRNGDWRILNGIDQELRDLSPAIEPLQTNRRSEANIIQFNNQCFQDALEFISDEVEKMTGTERFQEIKKAYSDVAQSFPQGKEGRGMVRNLFILSDRNREGRSDSTGIMLEHLLRQVELLQQEGIEAGQIAILVRRNKDITTIADYFAKHDKNPDYCYEIVSDEAFRLDSSIAVRVLTAALSVLAEKNDHHQEGSIPRNGLKLLLEDNLAFERFLDACPDLRQLPLTDAVWEIYGILNVKRFEGQDSYLFSFMDCLNEFCERESSDLDDFLQYWEEKLCRKTIPLGGKTQGIRILSIHKSKGLQYHTVLVPFCDWTLCTLHGTLWCSTDDPVFGQLPLIPVEFSKKQALSMFKEAYQDEVQQQVMDNLNLLYVALTRAEKNLITLSRDNERHFKTAGLSDMRDILFHAAAIGHPERAVEGETSENDNGLDGDGDEYTPQECLCFQKGLLFVHEPEESKVKVAQSSDNKNIEIKFLNNRHKVGFRQSNRSREFIRSLEEEDEEDARTLPSFNGASPNWDSYIERGKLLHKLFSEIRRPEDLDKAVFSLSAEGLLPAGQQESLLNYVREALQDPIASQWWSGDYRLYNECTILSEDEDGHIIEKRPDRVVERDGRIQVIDFKFGQHRPKYVEQVRGYMDLLAAMGHPHVEGYLWYVDQHEIRQVKRHECIILSSSSSEKQ